MAAEQISDDGRAPRVPHKNDPPRRKALLQTIRRLRGGIDDFWCEVISRCMAHIAIRAVALVIGVSRAEYPDCDHVWERRPSSQSSTDVLRQGRCVDALRHQLCERVLIAGSWIGEVSVENDDQLRVSAHVATCI